MVDGAVPLIPRQVLALRDIGCAGHIPEVVLQEPQQLVAYLVVVARVDAGGARPPGRTRRAGASRSGNASRSASDIAAAIQVSGRLAASAASAVTTPPEPRLVVSLPCASRWNSTGPRLLATMILRPPTREETSSSGAGCCGRAGMRIAPGTHHATHAHD